MKLLEVSKIIFLILSPAAWLGISRLLVKQLIPECMGGGCRVLETLKFSLLGWPIVGTLGLVLIFSLNNIKAAKTTKKISIAILYLLYLTGPLSILAMLGR